MKLILMLFLIVSCQDSRSNKNKGFSESNGLRIENLSELNGTYQADCQESLQNPQVFSLGFLKIKKNDNDTLEFTSETGYSNVENCSYGFLQAKLHGEMTLSTNNTQIHVEAIEAALKPLHESVRDGFNSSSQCGFDQWELNAYHSILSTHCLTDNKINYYVQSKDPNNNTIITYYCEGNEPPTTKCERIIYHRL